MKEQYIRICAFLLVIATLTLSGCGGADSEKGNRSPRSNPGSKTPKPTESPTPEPTSDPNGPSPGLEIIEPQVGKTTDTMRSGDLTLSIDQGAALGERKTNSTDGSMELTVEGFKGFKSAR